jgi:phage virion morphogenesis protein
MTDRGFLALDVWMAQALAALAPAERRSLFRRIGRELVKRNRAHMARQVGPDGAAWAPRNRDRHGRVKKAGKMMVGLRAARRLRATATPEGSEIGWTGRDARIAAVHQFGALDYVDRQKSEIQARYPMRPLIGLTPEDIALVRQTVMAHLAEKLPS